MTFKESVLIVFLALLLSGIGLFITNLFEAPTTAPRVVYEQIIKERHDTLLVLDTILKYKIKKIESEPDTIIIQKVDSIYGRTDTVFLGRELLKCFDSLTTCKQKIQIDSSVLSKIDTLIPTVTPKTEKACTIKEQATSFGLGTLFGITLRSFF